MAHRSPLKFVVVEHNSPLYRRVVDLRYRVLREPLGLNYTEEQLQAEKDEIHVAGMQGDRVAGCITLAPKGSNWVKFRQMAVDPAEQRNGVGSAMLAEAERMAKARGLIHVVLHARGTAIGFYEKSGYAITGDPFLEQTIPHQKMQKDLH